MNRLKDLLLAVLFPVLALLVFFVYLFAALETNRMIERDTGLEYTYPSEPSIYGYYYVYENGVWYAYPYPIP